MSKSRNPAPPKDEQIRLSPEHKEAARAVDNITIRASVPEKKFLIEDVWQHFHPTDPLTIVGVLKDPTASSVRFSAGNFTNWLTLPTVLIEEATFLGMLEEDKAATEKQFPLYSIAVVRPETQSEHFFFNLIMPPLYQAIKNATWTAGRFRLTAAADLAQDHDAAAGRPLYKRPYRHQKK